MISSVKTVRVKPYLPRRSVLATGTQTTIKLYFVGGSRPPQDELKKKTFVSGVTFDAERREVMYKAEIRRPALPWFGASKARVSASFTAARQTSHAYIICGPDDITISDHLLGKPFGQIRRVASVNSRTHRKLLIKEQTQQNYLFTLIQYTV